MSNKIQIRRGLKADLPTLDLGEFGLTTDTNELYIGGVSGNIEVGAGGGSGSFDTSSDTFMDDDTKFGFGGGGDYWGMYDTSASAYRFYTSDSDGSGTDGIIFSIADGTDTVDFHGNITIATNKNIKLGLGSSIFMGGTTTTGFVSPGSAIIGVYAGGKYNSWIGGEYTMYYNDVKVALGAGLAYWTVYNSTGTSYEFWTSDVDGSGTDGIIFSVEDGTDTVDFQGDITFATGKAIKLGLGGNIWMGGSTATGIISPGSTTIAMYADGSFNSYFAKTYTMYFNDVKVALGQDLDYWTVYNSTDTAYEFWTSNVDGLGADGKVFSVEDGTDTVDFHGSINLVSTGVVNGSSISVPAIYGYVDFYSQDPLKNYIKSFSAGDLRVVVGGFSVTRFSTSAGLGFQLMYDGGRFQYGTDSDYWHTYNPTGASYEFWANDSDGSGTDGIVFSVADGTDDVNFKGDIKLDTINKLVLDADVGSGQYITSTLANRTNYHSGAYHIFWGGGNVRLLDMISTGIDVRVPLTVWDNQPSSLGTNKNYWHVYNSTGGAGSGGYEFWSTNANGSGTDGIVFSVEDGTNDVNFKGSVILEDAQEIQFGNSFYRTRLAGYSAGEVRVFYGTTLHGSLGGSGVFAFAYDDKQIRLGNSVDYWHIYNSTGGSGSGGYEFWANDSDGSGTDGKVFWIEDGTDDVTFGGGINLKRYEQITFDSDETTPSEYITTTVSNHLLLLHGGAYVSTHINGLRTLQVSAQNVNLADNVKLGLGGNNTTEDYWTIYNSTGEAYEFWTSDADGAGTDGKVFSVADGTDDLTLGGDLLIPANTQRITFQAAASDHHIQGYSTGEIRFVYGTTPGMSIGPAVSGVALTAYNDQRIRIGVYADNHYWQVYNSTGNRFEFESNTGGPIFSVEDGEDDVAFGGGISLNTGEKLTFDTDTTNNNYIISDNNGELSLYVDGYRVIRCFQSLINMDKFTQFITGARMSGSTAYLGFGASDSYKMNYNTTSTAFQFWTSNTDGIDTDGIVFSVADGTDDVNFEGSLSLNLGEKLILNKDSGSDIYIDANSTNLILNGLQGVSIQRNEVPYIGVSAARISFYQPTTTLDDVKANFGFNDDYWHIYNSTNEAYEFWTSDTDGIGTDGKVFSVADGTDDIILGGSIYLNDNEVIKFGSSFYRTSLTAHPTGPIVVSYGSEPVGYIGTTEVLARTYDNKQIQYGSFANYWHIYNSTDDQFEFWSRDIDGVLTDGIVFSVEDGTDDVVFEGDIKLNVGGKLILDADGTGDDYLHTTADGSIELISNGSRIFFANAAYMYMGPSVDIQLTDNGFLYLGTNKDYWHTYTPTGTAYEFWTSDSDGIGTNGKVFSVADGTDDVNFSGNLITAGGSILSSTGVITLGGTGGTLNENLTFNFEPNVNRVDISSTSEVDTIRFSTLNLRLPTNRAFIFGDGNQVRLYGLTPGKLTIDVNAGNGATLDVNTADTITIKAKDGTGAGNLALDVGGKLIFDADEDSDSYIYTNSTGAYLWFFHNGASFMRYSPTFGEFTNHHNVWNNVRLGYGTNPNYWSIYNTTGGSGSGGYEFWSTNVSGTGTDGLVFSVADGTDDVNFGGGINLNMAEKLVLNADGAGNTYFSNDGLDSYTNYYNNGTLVYRVVSSRFIFQVSPEFTAGIQMINNSVLYSDKYLVVGGSLGAPEYWFKHNSTSTAYEFWSTDIDAGTGTDGKVFWIEDGTDDVNFGGGINLNADEKLVFDGDEDSDTYISSTSDGTYLQFIHNGTSFMRYSPTFAEFTNHHMVRSNIRLNYGDFNNYWHSYNSTGTAYEFWSTNVSGTGTDGKVFSIADGTDDVNFSGSLYLNRAEKIYFDADTGGTPDTYIGGTVDELGRIALVSQGNTVFQTYAGNGVFYDDVKVYHGATLDYWTTYNSTGTAYEFWTNDADGNGADGKIFSIQDGTNDIAFAGKISLTGASPSEGIELNRNALYLDANKSSSIYSANTDGVIRITAASQSVVQYRGTSATHYVQQHLHSDKEFSFGTLDYTTPNYWFVHNSVGTQFELWGTNVDGNATDGRILTIEDGTDDVNFGGNLITAGGSILSSTGTITLGGTGGTNNENLTFDFDAAANYVVLGSTTGATVLSLSGMGVNAPSFTIGTTGAFVFSTRGKILSLTNNQYSFRNYAGTQGFTADVNTADTLTIKSMDGTGAGNLALDGNVTLAGGSILDSTGTMTLGGTGGTNNNSLTLDFESGTSGRPIISSPSGHFILQGTTYFSSGFVQTDSSQSYRIGPRVALSSLAVGQLRLTDQISSGATLDVNTADTIAIKDSLGTGAGNLALDTGGKLVFDGDEDSDTYIYTAQTDDIRIFTGGAQQMRMFNGRTHMYADVLMDDDVDLLFGYGADQSLKYNSATEDVTWSDGTTNVITIPDDSNEIHLAGGKLLDSTGTITLGGTGGTYNHQMSIDLESEATRVNISVAPAAWIDINESVDISGNLQAYNITSDTYVSVVASGTFRIIDRAKISASADGLLQIANDAQTLGATLDVNTADTLTIKDQAGTGAGNLALGGSILNDTGTMTLGGTGGTNNENLTFDFETTANIIDINTTSGTTVLRNNLQLWQTTSLAFTSTIAELAWTNRFRFGVTATDGQVTLENQARTSGAVLDVATAGTITIKDQAGTGAGNLALDVGGKLILDGDGSATTFLDSPNGTYVDITVDNTLSSRHLATKVQFFSSAEITTGGSLLFGSDQSIDYNASDVTWNDGTTNVLTIPNDSNEVQLVTGGKIVFDGDADGDNYISMESTDVMAMYVSGLPLFKTAGSSGMYFYAANQKRWSYGTGYFNFEDNYPLAFGTGGDQKLTYTDGTGVTWNDGTNVVMTIPDDSNEVNFGGNVEISGNLTVSGGIFATKTVEQNTDTSSDPNAITDTESGKVFTNQGTAAQNYHNLPTAVAGLSYTFIVENANGIRVNASLNDTIRIAASVSANQGNIQSTTVGDSVTLVAINGTQWIATSVVGTGWSVT